jgi:hypothetical protein
MALVDIDPVGTPSGAFEWLMITIGVLLAVTTALFYQAGFL